MNSNRINVSLFEEKVGYDSANKKMMIRVYDSLLYVMEHSILKPSWTTIVKHMLAMDGQLGKVSVNGYYSTIRKILKDIGVIKYNGRKGLEKGPNWDRFYSDEDWSWFRTSTQNGGYGEIVEPNGMPY